MEDLFCKNVTFDLHESREFHVNLFVKANSERAYNQRKDHSQEEIMSLNMDIKCLFSKTGSEMFLWFLFKSVSY